MMKRRPGANNDTSHQVEQIWELQSFIEKAQAKLSQCLKFIFTSNFSISSHHVECYCKSCGEGGVIVSANSIL